MVLCSGTSGRFKQLLVIVHTSEGHAAVVDPACCMRAAGGRRFTESCHVNVVIMSWLTFCVLHRSHVPPAPYRGRCVQKTTCSFSVHKELETSSVFANQPMPYPQEGCRAGNVVALVTASRLGLPDTPLAGCGAKACVAEALQSKHTCSDLCTASHHWGQRSLGAGSMTAGRWAKAPAGGDSPMVPDADGGGPGVGARH